ncbi:hypothetical protein [Halioxenophilus sp. WMMB6]|uniref:hypothetical protein n=1 Tax=Halioxenophilus sp. WMMB6 TaxID=3073815 RepID=UPI00295EE1FD|nr:hypothetical protein [Halioxenophilus sp. WMMB6]
MGNIVNRLTQLVDEDSRYDIPHHEVQYAQIAAINERFQSRKDQIKLLGHRADQSGIKEISRLEDVVPLLFPHTAYKSYPESFLINEKWDRLGRWLDTVATYRVPAINASTVTDIDDWVAQLQAGGHFVSCSSGTTGKSAMLVASAQDMAWCRKEAITSYSWGSGVKPNRDRRIMGLAPVAQVPRNTATGDSYLSGLQDPSLEPFAYPVPPLTVGALTQMVVLRKAIADGTAKPGDLARYEATSAERTQSMDAAVGIAAQALVAYRDDKLHISGLWANLYAVAKAVRELGYSAIDFHPENSFYVGGGLKRAQLPDDYQTFVYETFNIAPERNYQNYSMQELHSGMPRCQEGGRYHLPPWVVPLILNKTGDELLPITEQEYEGRAAFFDLSIDGRWGGVISGDKVSIDFRPCACGARSPSIRDNIVRYADLEGDDKIGCAGTVDAYVRGEA